MNDIKNILQKNNYFWDCKIMKKCQCAQYVILLNHLKSLDIELDEVNFKKTKYSLNE